MTIPLRNDRSLLTTAEILVLTAVTDALVTRADGSHAASDLPNFDEWLQRAARARAADLPLLQQALKPWTGLTGSDLRTKLQQLNQQHRAVFDLVAAVAAGGYTMHPDVMRRVSYPGQQRNPPGLEEAVDELTSGIMDDVMERPSPIREAPE